MYVQVAVVDITSSGWTEYDLEVTGQARLIRTWLIQSSTYFKVFFEIFAKFMSFHV